MDAIDIVAMTFDSIPKIYSSMTVALPTNYKDRYLQIINTGTVAIQELGDLDIWTGEIFATAVLEFINKQNINLNNVIAIGSHGQTLWHAPRAARPFTMQIGDPNVIAVRTGITTIADFRRADVAAGGEGAPLAPTFHLALFANPTESRCIVNIGGYSNISVLEHNKYLGFDCGPGNCLMDYWAKTNFNQEYDTDGAIAATGKISNELLAAMLTDPYFALPPPKSTGREYFNSAWLQQHISNFSNCGKEDIMATLLQLTTECIANAARTYATPGSKIFLCGGGAKNTALRNALSQKLEQEVQTTLALGIDPTWVEAALFAWLAKECYEGNSINTPAITGAKKPVILGGIYGLRKRL